MTVEYLGHSSFLLTAADGTRLVTDPYAGIGYPMPHAEAAVSYTHLVFRSARSGCTWRTSFSSTSTLRSWGRSSPFP